MHIIPIFCIKKKLGGGGQLEVHMVSSYYTEIFLQKETICKATACMPNTKLLSFKVLLH